MWTPASRTRSCLSTPSEVVAVLERGFFSCVARLMGLLVTGCLHSSQPPLGCARFSGRAFPLWN